MSLIKQNCKTFIGFLLPSDLYNCKLKPFFVWTDDQTKQAT